MIPSVLQGVHRTHLVGDRTNAANAGHDVGHLAERTALQKGLEESWRLINRQAHGCNLVSLKRNMQPSFTFHAAQCVDLDRATLGHGVLLGRTIRDVTGFPAASSRSLSARKAGAAAL